MTALAARLVAAGMSPRESRSKTELFRRCVGALQVLSGGGIPSPPPLVFFVPGRIEVFGKHTDYAGGRSLLCAMERGFILVATPRGDSLVRVVDALRGDTRALALDPMLAAERGDWANYVAAVARGIARHFPNARRGADIALASDLPAASGMSSSSALVTGVFMALAAANRLAEDASYRRVITSPESLAGYLGALESGRGHGPFAGGLGVGTLGGSQDHTAILCCRAGVVSCYAFCPVRSEAEVALAADRTFVVAHSGIAAEKSASALLRYNEASLAVTEILRLWNATTSRADACLADAIASAPEAAGALRELVRHSGSGAFTAQRLHDRLEQFVAESYEIIPAAVDAFSRGDHGAIGRLAARSQRGAETLLGNQVPETIALVRIALEHGADAASAFGAGFGGGVWALVPAADAAGFADAWRRSYGERFPSVAERAEFIVTRPGPGAMQL